MWKTTTAFLFIYKYIYIYPYDFVRRHWPTREHRHLKPTKESRSHEKSCSCLWSKAEVKERSLCFSAKNGTPVLYKNFYIVMRVEATRKLQLKVWLVNKNLHSQKKKTTALGYFGSNLKNVFNKYVLRIYSLTPWPTDLTCLETSNEA